MKKSKYGKSKQRKIKSKVRRKLKVRYARVVRENRRRYEHNVGVLSAIQNERKEKTKKRIQLVERLSNELLDKKLRLMYKLVEINGQKKDLIVFHFLSFIINCLSLSFYTSLICNHLAKKQQK